MIYLVILGIALILNKGSMWGVLDWLRALPVVGPLFSCLWCLSVQISGFYGLWVGDPWTFIGQMSIISYIVMKVFELIQNINVYLLANSSLE